MIYELLELSRVLAAVQTTGTEVRYYDERCDTHEVSGFYRFGPNVDRLVICPRNHINHSDLFDTIRHEAIHVVQACNHKPIMPYDYYLKNAPDDVSLAIAAGLNVAIVEGSEDNFKITHPDDFKRMEKRIKNEF